MHTNTLFYRGFPFDKTGNVYPVLTNEDLLTSAVT